MMKFVNLIAKYIGEGMIFLAGFQPLISQTHPKAEPVFGKADDVLVKIAGLVAQIQVIGTANASVQMSGAQRAAAITPLVAQALKDSALVSGHVIDDVDGFTKTAEAMGGLVYDLMQTLKTDNIKVASN
jgi:hypothetical protein